MTNVRSHTEGFGIIMVSSSFNGKMASLRVEELRKPAVAAAGTAEDRRDPSGQNEPLAI
ncbi:MAG: hypothetical protein PVI27_00765 [Desulfobacteraceae bacterium]